jgi:stage II sporulation protein D
MRVSSWRVAGMLVLVWTIGCTLAAATSATGPASLRAPVVLEGHGLGHGIGLSQWGAEERAAAGETLSEILSFYYPHTMLVQGGSSATAPVRVLVAEAPVLKVGSWGSYTASDSHGRLATLNGMTRASLDAFGTTNLTFPLQLTPLGQPLRVGGLPYAGTVRIVRRGQTLLAINDVPVEDYVRGVVSTENPAYWPAEALQAQAVAARSYVTSHRRAHAPFDVFSDDRSQNYRGLARNFPTAQRAVLATAGQVLEFHGRIADAMFSASNGGLTGDGKKPYLVTRPDPFDARSPAANWGPVTISAARLAAVFPELPAAVSSLSFAHNRARRVTVVTLGLSDGRVRRVSGSVFQQRLGLRSTYFEATEPA